jgi:hypothetical protein
MTDSIERKMKLCGKKTGWRPAGSREPPPTRRGFDSAANPGPGSNQASFKLIFRLLGDTSGFK